jgi:hypothetical protein
VRDRPAVGMRRKIAAGRTSASEAGRLDRREPRG